VAAAARVVVVVRSVVEVATEAATVVKVVAAEEVTAVDEGGGRGGAPIPQTPIVVFGGRGVWPHNATSTQSAVLKNTGAYPEGIIGTRCSGGGQLPATRSCLVTSENSWFERGEEGLRANFARDMRAAPGAVAGSGRREADAYLEGQPGGTWW
jgi:hypothetical protein